MKRLFLIGAFLLMIKGTNAQPLLWDMEELNEFRTLPTQKDFQYITKLADAIIQRNPVSVTEKETTRSGNKHNFESLSIYYWPNPDDPAGPYIVKDGQRNPEYKKYDLPRLSTLNHNTHYLARAYYLTGEEAYLRAFVQQIDTWFIQKDTRMTPHFEYAQFIPGRNEGKGCSAGLIDAYNFIDVIESVRLVDSVHPIGKKRMKKFKAWFADFSSWMQKSETGRGAAAMNHNIGTAYDILLYYLALFEGDKETAQHVAAAFEEKRIIPQIEADGTQPIQQKRTKVFSYSVSNLYHIMDMCILQKEVPSRVRKALMHLSQYIGKKELFPYQEIGDWEEAEKKLHAIIRRANQLGCDIRY